MRVDKQTEVARRENVEFGDGSYDDTDEQYEPLNRINRTTSFHR